MRRSNIRKDPSRDAWFVPYPGDREFCLVAVETNATNNHVLHARGRFLSNCSGARFETRPHLEFASEFFCKLHRPRLHHLRPGTSHLEQLVIGKRVEFVRVSHAVRNTSEDTIDIGKNLAD